MDIRFTEDFDYAISEFGNDLETITEDNEIYQSIVIRLMTTNPDWFKEPIGADLEDFIGKPNDTQTLEEIKDRIIKSIMMVDGVVDCRVFYKQPNSFVSLFYTVVETENGDIIAFTINFDFAAGASFKRIQLGEM